MASSDDPEIQDHRAWLSVLRVVGADVRDPEDQLWDILDAPTPRTHAGIYEQAEQIEELAHKAWPHHLHPSWKNAGPLVVGITETAYDSRLLGIKDTRKHIDELKWELMEAMTA